MPNESQIIPSIFDLHTNGKGILRMPFNPIHWGSEEANAIEYPCYECGELFPRGSMKALNADKGGKGAIRVDSAFLGKYGIFFCRNCWFSSKYSDASNWKG